VPSCDGVVVMGWSALSLTMLHPQEMKKPELPPPLEVVSPSSMDSLRIVSSDSDPL
jgi:hypothetical protein